MIYNKQTNLYIYKIQKIRINKIFKNLHKFKLRSSNNICSFIMMRQNIHLPKIHSQLFIIVLIYQYIINYSRIQIYNHLSYTPIFQTLMKSEEILSNKRNSLCNVIRSDSNRLMKEEMRQKFFMQIQKKSIEQINLTNVEYILKNYQYNPSLQNVKKLCDIVNSKDALLIQIIDKAGFQIINIGLENIGSKQGRCIIGNLSDFEQIKKYLLMKNLVKICIEEILQNENNKQVVAQYIWILANYSFEIQTCHQYFYELKPFYNRFYQIMNVNKHFVRLIYQLSINTQLMPQNQLIVQIILEAITKKIKLIKIMAFELCVNFVIVKNAAELIPHYPQFFQIYLQMLSPKNDNYVHRRAIKMLKTLINKIGDDMIQIILREDYLSDLLIKIEISNNSLKDSLIQVLYMLILHANNSQIFIMLQNSKIIETLLEILLNSAVNSQILLALKSIEILINIQHSKYENEILNIFLRSTNFIELIEDLCLHDHKQICQIAENIMTCLLTETD